MSEKSSISKSEVNYSTELAVDPRDILAQTSAEVTVVNPYERLTDEQLIQVRDNIADSVIQGIRRYDTPEVTRASINLAAIRREFEARFPELKPAHQRGEVDGDITYVTAPDPEIVQKITREVMAIDGTRTIVAGMKNNLPLPQPNWTDRETKLQALETFCLLTEVQREIRRVDPSEFNTSVNPYSSYKNEELTRLVARFKDAIQSQADKGFDTQQFRDSLTLIGKVVKSRQ